MFPGCGDIKLWVLTTGQRVLRCVDNLGCADWLKITSFSISRGCRLKVSCYPARHGQPSWSPSPNKELSREVFFLKSKELLKRCVNTIWAAYFICKIPTVFFFWSNKKERLLPVNLNLIISAFSCKFCLWSLEKLPSRMAAAIKAGKWFLILALPAVATWRWKIRWSEGKCGGGGTYSARVKTIQPTALLFIYRSV